MSTHCKANIETDIYTEQTEDFDRTAHVVATSNVDSKNEDDAEAVRHPPTISAALRDSEFSASLALSFFFLSCCHDFRTGSDKKKIRKA